jgi:hypothetical protein
MIANQAKVVSNHDQHLENDFIDPLVVKIFGCLHQHQCANMAWLAKGSRGPPLSIMCSSYR